ncbi:MAG: pSRTUE45c [Frankiales bacterium]|nr:pSRTUE45c [Frankiales bacterium]
MRAADVSSAVVRAASKVRGERILHAKGRTFTAEVTTTGSDLGVPLLDEPATHRAVVRLSRGAGLPDLLPDALGLAIRLLDAHGPGRHQDLLLTTGTDRPVLRHAIVPRRDLLASTYTSLVPYRLGGRSLLVAARPDGDGHQSSVHVLRPDDVRFRLSVGTTLGPWRDVATVRATGVHPDGRAIRFSPFTTGGGIWPGTAVQELRRTSYSASRVGRDS